MQKPSKIHLHKKSKSLELTFNNINYLLPAEFLRVHSPSAEVKGHGPGQETLVFGKIDVGIEKIIATGNYGLTIIFNDNHDSGIYSWSYLAELGQNQDTLWASYLKKLSDEKKDRDPLTTVIQFKP